LEETGIALPRNAKCVYARNVSIGCKQRTDKFNLKWNDFFTGLFKKHNQSKTIQLLLELADEVGLKSAIADYFDGAIIKIKPRAVLHTALRAKNPKQ
jgi:uncharacterized protein YihD (DUF1040 family)